MRAKEESTTGVVKIACLITRRMCRSSSLEVRNQTSVCRATGHGIMSSSRFVMDRCLITIMSALTGGFVTSLSLGVQVVGE